jgi:hypothetical protein
MEFTPADVAKVVSQLIAENLGDFTNVISLSLFVSNVGKRLIDSVQHNSLTLEERVDVIAKIGSQVVEELENNGHITLELALQFREVLSNTDEFKSTITAVSNFVIATPEERKSILSKFLCGCITSILGPARPEV